MSVYERSTNTDGGFQKRIQASIEKIKTHSILQKIRSSEDRYEISPTLKLSSPPRRFRRSPHLSTHGGWRVRDAGAVTGFRRRVVL